MDGLKRFIEDLTHPSDQGYYNTGWFNPEMRSRAVF